MNILPELISLARWALPQRRTWASPGFTDRASEVLLDDVPGDRAQPGCGWFDSSHELQHGLLVTEHAEAAQLPLDAWLSLHLADRRGTSSAGPFVGACGS